MRGFEIIKGYDEIAELPKRGTKFSSGYDIKAAKTIIIQPNSIGIVETGIKAYMEENEVLKVYVRSSMGIKKNLTLANQVGIIDSDYYNNPSNEGHIFVAIRNNNSEEVTINAGDRIAQAIFEKFLIADEDHVLTEERTGGIGSTGE